MSGFPGKTKPVEFHGSKDRDDYPMSFKERGLCYIFNHKKFNPSLKLNERRGTNADVELLKQVFEDKLGFIVNPVKPDVKYDVGYDDCTYEEINYRLQQVEKEDQSLYSCFVCCVLTYGTNDGRLHARDGPPYPVQRLYENFYAKSLAGKPKIFIIQACPCDTPKPVPESTDFGSQDRDTFKIPTNADCLVVYSTVEGDLSWNYNVNQGSWFVDALCSTINQYISKMDLLQLLSIVNYKLSLMYKKHGNNVPPIFPCVTSTLTRDIKLCASDVRDSVRVTDSDFVYEIGNLNQPKQIKVLIFIHERYKRNWGPLRNGAAVDLQNLKQIFEADCFKVEVFTDNKKEDMKKKSILKKLSKVANEPHEMYGGFICCISTHGDCGELCAYDKSYKIDDMLSLFYNKWNDKPKVFFLQACQGKKLNPGFEMVEKFDQQTLSSDSEDSDSEVVVDRTSVNFRHLSHPDFLIVSSTVPGYFSFRSETHGSWFVQELHKIFTTHFKDKDFLQLLTETNRKVAIQRRSYFENKMDPRHNKKQTLCLTSTLTKNIDLRSFYQPS